MSFVIKYDDVLDRYNEIWNKIKKASIIKFHRIPVYDTCFATEMEFNCVIKTNFLRDDIPEENVHYACIACITSNSVMRMEKRN